MSGADGETRDSGHSDVDATSATGVEIRAARGSEVEAVVAAYEWLFAPPGSEPPGWDRAVATERLAATIDSEAAEALVADRDGKIVGFCTAYIDLLSVRYGLRCWVEDLAVDPAERSRGVGTMLLRAARRWAAAHGASHLELDSGDARADAHRFYEREGANVCGRSFGWHGERL